MRSIKSLILLSIIAVTLSLSVGYVSLTASIKQGKNIMKQTEMNVAITDVEVININGFADAGSPIYKGSTVYFTPGLDNLNESVTYSVTLTNQGDKVVLLDNIQFLDSEGGNSKIYFSSSTPAYELNPGESTTMTVIAAYDQTVISDVVEEYKETKCVVTYIEK